MVPFMSILLAILMLGLLKVPAAFAQGDTIVLPTVPNGLPPLLTYALSLLSVVLSVAVPILIAVLKQRFNIANAADQHDMIDRAVKHGALLTYAQEHGVTPVMAPTRGFDYAKMAAATPIGKTKTTDDHINSAITAEVIKLNQSPPFIPGSSSMIGADVSELRSVPIDTPIAPRRSGS